jgi:hypothetical protein
MPSAINPPRSWGRRACPAQSRLAVLYVFPDVEGFLAWRNGPQHLDVSSVELLRALDHHDRIGPWRKHATRVNDCRLRWADREFRRTTHQHFTHDGEISRQRLAGSKGIGGADGIAIHRAARKGRQRRKRRQRLGQHAVERIGSGNRFCADRTRQVVKQNLQRICRWKNGEQLWHRPSFNLWRTSRIFTRTIAPVGSKVKSL